MAIRPARMFSLGRTGGIKHARLRNQNVRPLRMFALPHFSFTRGDFGQPAADMNRSCAPTCFCFPGDRVRKSPIEFKNSWAMPETGELALETAWQHCFADV